MAERKTSLRNRVGGTILIAGIALGFLLSQLWNFSGFGTSDLEQNGADDSAQVETSLSDTSAESTTANLSAVKTQNPGQVDMSATTSGSRESVTVAIHRDRYRLTSREDPLVGMEISLEELVRQTSRASGGSQGIRLRVLLHKDAQEGALADLYAELEAAGVKREEIQEYTGYID